MTKVETATRLLLRVRKDRRDRFRKERTKGEGKKEGLEGGKGKGDLHVRSPYLNRTGTPRGKDTKGQKEKVLKRKKKEIKREKETSFSDNRFPP